MDLEDAALDGLTPAEMLRRQGWLGRFEGQIFASGRVSFFVNFAKQIRGLPLGFPSKPTQEARNSKGAIHQVRFPFKSHQEAFFFFFFFLTPREPRHPRDTVRAWDVRFGQPHRWLGPLKRPEMDYLLIDLGLKRDDLGLWVGCAVRGSLSGSLP